MVLTSIYNLDDSITLEYAIIEVELAETGFDDFKVDWEAMEFLAEQHCKQEIQCTGTLVENEAIDLRLQSKNVYTFIFLHQSGAEGLLEVQVESSYDNSKNSMTKAVLLSLPSLYITAFVAFRLYRLNNNERQWFDPQPSHTWEEE